MTVQTGPSATAARPTRSSSPPGRTFRLTDLVLNNPQGDFGRLLLTQTPAGGDPVVLFDVALENFRDNDFHFQTPIVLPAGTALTMSVLCRAPGVREQTPPPTQCDDALVFKRPGSRSRPRRQRP